MEKLVVARALDTQVIVVVGAAVHPEFDMMNLEISCGATARHSTPATIAQPDPRASLRRECLRDPLVLVVLLVADELRVALGSRQHGRTDLDPTSGAELPRALAVIRLA